MNKFLLTLQGYAMCFSWIPKMILHECPDLLFWRVPTHPSDFIAYAERINGRLAMLAIVIILNTEFFTHESIWRTLNIM